MNYLKANIALDWISINEELKGFKYLDMKILYKLLRQGTYFSGSNYYLYNRCQYKPKSYFEM